MKKSIAENLTRGLSIAVALIIATVMMLCAGFNVSAKNLGSNLVIEDTDVLLSDINVTSASDFKMKQLIATGANVELIPSATNGSVTSDGNALFYFNIKAVDFWTNNNAVSFVYFFDSSDSANKKAWSTASVQYSGDTHYVKIPSGTWDRAIITRHKNGTTSPTWETKWNQTGDIVLQSDKNYISSFSENKTVVTWGTNVIPTPSIYSINADKTSIKEGETVTFTPSINQTDYVEIQSNEFSVSGGSSSDYTINNTNKTITFKKSGTYTVTDKITYNAKGYSSITGNVTTSSSSVTITVAPAYSDVAESVSLTAGSGRFAGKTFDLTATLTNKNDTGAVTYTFSKVSGGDGTFSTTTVNTADSSATVSFTPSTTGDYTFKVVVSESNHNNIETTLKVSVKSSEWYVFGQWTGGWDTDATNLKKNPMTYDEENKYFYFTKEAVIYQGEADGVKKENLYFRLYDGKNQMGGSDTSNDTVITTTKPYVALCNNNSKALKVTGLAETEIVTVYTDGTYVWYSKTEGKEYNVAVDSNISHGTVTADKATAKPGETVTLTVNPADGYELSTLKYNTTDIDKSTKKFTMPTQDVTITATFTPITYTIQYYIDGTEDTSFEPKSYTVESENITLQEPAERTGYTFSGWHLNSESGDPTTTIPKGSTGNKQFYGKYVANKYTVTFNAGEGGTVTPETKEVTYNSTYGDLPIPNKSGYTFRGWYCGDTLIESSTKVEITSDITLVAVYVDNPTITVTIMYNDAVDKDKTKATVTGAGQLTYGADSKVTITPANGYYISAISGIDGSYEVANGAWEKNYTNITSEINIVATISDNPSVTVDVYYNDKKVMNMATVNGDGKTSGYGVNQTVTVAPNEGYYIKNVKENDALLNTYTAKAGTFSYTFKGKQNTVISVYLNDNPKVKVKYVDVRSDAVITNGNVAVTIDGKQNTDDGVSVGYNSTPKLNAIINTANSYKFVGYFSADGTTSLSTTNPYTLSSVQSDTEIVAKFDKLYEITIKWKNLDGLKVDDKTLTNEELLAGTYYIYRPQSSKISLTTTINKKSEYKLNADCFVSSNLVGVSYNQKYSSNVTTKEFNFTVGSTAGEIEIKPVPATYSGSGYWGDKVLKINASAVIGDSPYFTVKFSKSGASDIEARMVCADTTNKIYECPIPTGYDSITLYRRKPSDGTVWNSASTTLDGKTEFTAKFDSGVMVLEPKSGT